MARYNYIVINPKGERIKGEREATSQNEVTDYLYSLNYNIISIEEKIGFDYRALAKSEIGGLPVKDKVIGSSNVIICFC